jgi:hypothetical protein
VTQQLVSYIAPGAPATRRSAEGNELFLRPEIGFTPAWYRQHLPLDFGERFHRDPAYRRQRVVQMRAELRRRFPGTGVGATDRADEPLDLLTGTFGACLVAAIYGVPLIYAADNWPNCAHQYLSDEQMAALRPPDLDRNEAFQELLGQMDWIAAQEGRVEGFINWQGLLNNAHRLRGEALFTDLVERPEVCRQLFECICTTMIDGTRKLHERQRRSGVELRFVTVSNCLVNLISPRTYRQLLLPFDQRLAEVYGTIGIHNCAWNATPYLASYTEVTGVAYIDMGIDSDLLQARRLFPEARRAVMYTPMDLANQSSTDLEADLRRIGQECGPADVVCADIEAGTPDSRVLELVALCRPNPAWHPKQPSL